MRRLREFIPRDGTELVAQQKEVEARRVEEATTEIEGDPEEYEADGSKGEEPQESSEGDKDGEQEQ